MDKVTLPEGQANKYRVERFVISETEARFFNLSEAFNNHGVGYRGVRPGEYTRLMYGGEVLMTDTGAEMREHWQPVHIARGRCLINGLGLGVVLQACLQKPEVERITVVEISADVINLVAPHYLAAYGGERLEVVCCDAFGYRPPPDTRYQMVWNDIWPYISVENYEGMKALHRKYGRCADWVGSWQRETVKRLVARDKRDTRYSRWF